MEKLKNKNTPAVEPIHVLSRKMEKAVLRRIKGLMRSASEPRLPGVNPGDFSIVCNFGKYASPAEAADALDTGTCSGDAARTGWHDRTDAEQAMCIESFAATELRRYLCCICGLDETNPTILPFRRPSEAAGLSTERQAENCFVVGSFQHNPEAALLARKCGIKPARPPPESVHVRTIKQKTGLTVLLLGADPNGALYAVYDFLEKLGCRFFGPGKENEHVPRSAGIALPEDYDARPGFPMRFFHGHLENRGNLALFSWMARNKINWWGADTDYAGMRRRGLKIYGGNHWLQKHVDLPREKLLDKLCVGDAEFMREFARRVVDLYADGCYMDCDAIDYLAGDWGERCKCEKCKAVGNAASREITVTHYIRQEAQRRRSEGKLNRDLPVMFWAYYDANSPPDKPVPPDFDYEHCIAGFWTMYCNAHLSFDSSCTETWTLERPDRNISHTFPSNRELHQRFQEWVSGEGHWKGRTGWGEYYVMARNHMLPVPYMTLVSREIPHCHRLGAHYVSCMHIAPGDWGQKTVLNYLFAKLSWNPRENAVNLLADYFVKRYGPCAEMMARHYFALERAMSNLAWLRGPFIRRLNQVCRFNEELFVWEHLRSEAKISAQNYALSIAEILQELDAAAEQLSLARQLTGCLALASRAPQSQQCPSPDDAALKARISEDAAWFEYADAMQRLYASLAECWETGRKSRHRWTWQAEDAHAAFEKAVGHYRRLAAVDLPINLVGVHYRHAPAQQAAMADSILDHIAWLTGVDISYLRHPPAVHINPPPQEILKKRWENASRYRHYFPVAGRVDGKMRIFIQGHDREAKPWRQALRCLDADGKVVWERFSEDDEGNVLGGVFTNLLELDGAPGRLLNLSEMHYSQKPQTRIFLVNASDGSLYRRLPLVNPPPVSNGCTVAEDLDGDGHKELVVSTNVALRCYRAPSLEEAWIVSKDMGICHGRTAIADLDGDGKKEIILGSEYGNPDKTSSITALKHDGSVLWKSRSFPHDLGSTSAMIADVNNDGRPEILHVGLDLCHRGPVRVSRLYCFSAAGESLWEADFGGHCVAIGDVDGDGVLEGVGITSVRDGGILGKREIICFSLAEGKRKWAVPVPRVYLAGDPIIAHLDEDGLPEIIVSTGHLSGYAKIPGERCWGDVYILKGDGKIVWRETFADIVNGPIVCDLDGDGLNEVIMATGNGYIYAYNTRGKRSGDGEWPVIAHDLHRTSAAV